MYLRHKKKSNRFNLGLIDYCLILMCIVMLILTLMRQFGIEVSDLPLLMREYLLNSL